MDVSKLHLKQDFCVLDHYTFMKHLPFRSFLSIQHLDNNIQALATQLDFKK